MAFESRPLDRGLIAVANGPGGLRTGRGGWRRAFRVAFLTAVLILSAVAFLPEVAPAPARRPREHAK